MNTEARDALIDANLRLPHILANQFLRHVPYGRGNLLLVELVSAGFEALVSSANRYDGREFPTFRSFAKERIIGAMKDYLRSIDLQSTTERRSKAVHERWHVAIGALYGQPSTRGTSDQVEARAQVENLLAKLNPRFATILRMRFLQEADLATIGAVFSLTEGRVCQIVNSAIDELRYLSRSSPPVQ